MGIIKDFRKFRRTSRREKSAIDPAQKVSSRSFIYTSWLPRWILGDYSLRNSELLFSAVSRISNSLSAMPVQLYKGTTPIKNTLNDIVSFEPNGSMTSCQFIKSIEACRCTSGNGYAIKQFDSSGNLEKLELVDPSRITPALDIASGELWYRLLPEKGSEIFVHSYYIIHVPFLSTNGYMGISPVSVLQNTLDYSDNIQKFNVSQLKDGVSSRVVLNAPGNLGETQKTEAIESFMETYRKTSGNILMLESGITATTLNLSPIDAKIFEVEKISRSKVAMVYNIPPHLMGDYSEPALRSQEHLMLQFLMLTMLPIVTAYEQEFNRKLLTRDQRKRGYHFKFNMEAILRADAATMADVNFKAVRSAIKTPDEIRSELHMPPLSKGIGKHAMISQDMATLDYTVNVKPKVLAQGLDDQADPDHDPEPATAPPINHDDEDEEDKE